MSDAGEKKTITFGSIYTYLHETILVFILSFRQYTTSSLLLSVLLFVLA